MGKISKMQGTPAHLERLRNPNSVKGHSCKTCVNYFDGVCKAKKVALIYGENYARTCRDYLKSLGESYIYKKILRKAEQSPKKKIKQTKISLKEKTKTQELKKVEGAVFYGDTIKIRDVDTKEIFELSPIEKEPKNNNAKEICSNFLNRKVGDYIKFRECGYEIIDIKTA